MTRKLNENTKLTEKQRFFVKEYIVDFNGTRAAIAAGFGKKNARSTASELLTKPHVQAALALEIEKRIDRIEVTQEMVINELRKLAFSNMRHFVSWGPTGIKLKESTEIDHDKLACIAAVSETTTEHGGAVRFKLHDKIKSLELLGRHLGLFPIRSEFTSKDGQLLTPPQPPSVEVYLLARKKALRMV